MNVYGLVHSNAKLKHQSEEHIHNTDLSHLSVIPQLLYFIINNQLVPLMDDLFMNGEDMEFDSLVQEFNKKLSPVLLSMVQMF